MPYFDDFSNSDSFIGFQNYVYTDIRDAVISIDDALPLQDAQIIQYSSIAVLWWASIGINDFNPNVVKAWRDTIGRRNFGSYIVISRGRAYDYVYMSRTGTFVPPHKMWYYNPAFYAGNRYVPSEATYAVQLSGEFPLVVGVSTKPAAVFQAVSSPGDTLRVTVPVGVFGFTVTVTYQIWGTFLLPGPTQPLTFVEI